MKQKDAWPRDVAKGADTKIEAYGVRGRKSKPWRRTFASYRALVVWQGKNNAYLIGTREAR